MPYIELDEYWDVDDFYSECSNEEKKELVKLLKEDGFFQEGFDDELSVCADAELTQKIKYILKYMPFKLQEDWKGKIDEFYNMLNK
jgi:hypothetical protein